MRFHENQLVFVNFVDIKKFGEFFQHKIAKLVKFTFKNKILPNSPNFRQKNTDGNIPPYK